MYEAVYGRKSVRKYRMEPLNQNILSGIFTFMDQMEPLFPGIKIKLEIVVSSEEWKEKTIAKIQEIARTGEVGDGKIFAYAITDAVKIRTGETGYDALQSKED